MARAAGLLVALRLANVGALAPLVLSVSAHLRKNVSIADFGAVADNHTINTVAIQRAIDTAAAAGGGLVIVPPGGVYKTGALSLQTNVSVFLPSGSNLLGSSNPDDYTGVVGGNWDRWDVFHSSCSSCGLVGDAGATGTLQGPMWQMIDGFDASENQLQPVRWTNISGCIGECRPRLLVFEDSEDVSVSNVQLRDSADWTQLYRRSTGVRIENVTVWGSQQWPNNDGVDFESCAHVVYRNVSSFTGDDGVVFGSGNCNQMLHPWPGGPPAPTTDVLVENCTLSSYSSAIKWESIFEFTAAPGHGNVSGVVIRDVSIVGSNRGIGFQQRTGPGSYTNVTIERVTIEARGVTGDTWWGAGEALWVTVVPERSGLGYNLGGIQGVTITNVTTLSEQGALLMARNCAPGAACISDVTLSNVSVGIAVLGNATRPGRKDYRPIDDHSAPQWAQVDVSGWYFESVAGAAVRGGTVAFEGAPQPFWARGVCVNATPDSNVTLEGMSCEPAGAA